VIKLFDLLIEGTINAITSNAEENKASIDEIIGASKEMGESHPLIYRGINTRFLLTKVGNERISFRGGNLGAKTILSVLGVQYPLFGYDDPALVKFFGSPTIVVLKKPYKIFQSQEVEDIMVYAQREIYKTEKTNGGILRQQTGTRTEDEIIDKAKEGASTYKKIDGSSFIKSREIVMDAKEYWAVSLQIKDRGGKFMPQKIDTYGELAYALNSYKKYLTYNATKRN
jgi:hypothetical protein